MFTQSFDPPSLNQYLYTLSIKVKGKCHLESTLLRFTSFMVCLSDKNYADKNWRQICSMFFPFFKDCSLASFRTARKDGQRRIRFIHLAVPSASSTGRRMISGSKHPRVAILPLFSAQKRL